MVIGLIGENCSGKSTLANNIKKHFGAEVITGKDYLRMGRGILSISLKMARPMLRERG